MFRAYRFKNKDGAIFVLRERGSMCCVVVFLLISLLKKKTFDVFERCVRAMCSSAMCSSAMCSMFEREARESHFHHHSRVLLSIE